MFIEDLEVLLIENNPNIYNKIIDIIKSIDEEYNITLKSSSREAIRVLKEKPHFYNCIFYNYTISDSDGFDFLKELQTWEVSAIIAVYDEEPNYKKAISLIKNGAFDYFDIAQITKKQIDKIISSVFRHLILANEKEEYKKKLKERDRTIKAITTVSPNIIYVYDIPSKKVIFHNRNLFKILGYNNIPFKDGVAISKMIKSISDDDDYQKINQFLEKAINSPKRKAFDFEFSLRSKEGNKLWFQKKIIIFKRNANGLPSQILVTISNITELKETESRLRLAKQEAENSAQIKAEFLSNMSHEIRTPMNAIIGLTNIVLLEELPEQIEDNLNLIKQSADNLLVIINDILDFSKLEAGKMKIESIPFSIKEKMEHIVKTTSLKLKNEQVKLNLFLDDNVSPFLEGDPFRLNQIFLNLLSNAIKFTEKGSIDVIIKSLKKEKGKNKILFSVKDTGLGIPKEKQNAIFDSFTQADLSTTRNYGGTGLGLTITKLLVSLMGGEILLKSTFGKGSRFDIILDFIIFEGELLEDKGENEERILSNARILVVEDNFINQKVISQILKRWKIDFSMADNGKQALNILQEKVFDLILMDLQMPIMDGFETTNIIRKDKKYQEIKNIPIIALTADAFVETQNKVFKNKMNAFVSKPFNKLDLNEKIYQLIRK